MKPITRIRSMAILLRVVAVSLVLSGFTFFLPEGWIDSFLVFCGVGEMPHAPLMRYVLWMAGFFQIAGGVLCWVVSSDVVRYQVIVLAGLVLLLVGAPVMYLIDAMAGLPWYWSLLDFMCCFLAGGVPLAVWFWPSSPKQIVCTPS